MKKQKIKLPIKEVKKNRNYYSPRIKILLSTSTARRQERINWKLKMHQLRVIEKFKEKRITAKFIVLILNSRKEMKQLHFCAVQVLLMLRKTAKK